jgi:hypothetical protein
VDEAELAGGNVEGNDAAAESKNAHQYDEQKDSPTVVQFILRGEDR